MAHLRSVGACWNRVNALRTGRLVGRKFAFSIWMEFMGLMLFSLFGNSVTPEYAPAGNGERRAAGNLPCSMSAAIRCKGAILA